MYVNVFLQEKHELKTGIPSYKNFLIKVAKSDTHMRESTIEYSENSKNFIINSNYSHLKKQRFFLIDDVITTGSTLEAAGYCIFKN